MLRSSRFFSPVRASTALRNGGASPMVGRPASLIANVGHEAPSTSQTQNRTTHTKASSRVPRLASTRLAPLSGPSTRFLVAYSTKERPPVKYEIDREHEKKVGQEKLEAHPDEVTAESSVRHLREPYEEGRDDKDPAVSSSLKSDVNSIKETLDLSAVPREVYALGLGGTVPYFLTSLSTIYLGWNLRHSYPTSSSLMNTFMVSQETAHQWLALLEPIQLGFGAVIISFLGAIHWGMEFNEKTPSYDRTRFRYMMGVVAPALAWPTLLLPVHFALTGQFLAFTLLYFADSRATKRGWVPPWYQTYRFVLTFVVGSAILVSLIFRAKIDDVGENMTERLEKGMHQRGAIEEGYSEKWAKLEAADKEKAKKEAAEKKKQEKKAKNEKKEEEEKEGKEGKSGDDKGKAEEKSEDSEDSSGDKSGDSDEKSDEKADGKDEKKGDDGKDDKDEQKDTKDDGKSGSDEKEDGTAKQKDADKDGSKSDDNTKGDEKKGAVDGDTSSKKKAAKGDDKSKGKK